MTIKIPDRISARVARLAREQQVTKSDVVRDALEEWTGRQTKTFIERFGHVVGVVKGAPRDLSTNKRHLRGYGK